MTKFTNENFSNLNAFCFDLDQYKKDVKYLVCTVFVNYKGELYDTDFNILIADHCKWNGSKWNLRYNIDMIKYFGLDHLLIKIKNEELNCDI
jgi:hypothetical protein